MLSLAPAQLCKATIFLALCAASWAVEPFVYMYPLPSYYHSGMSRYWRSFEDTTYDADREMVDYLLTEGLLTTEPCNATVFLVPAYTADYLQAVAFGGDLRRHWKLSVQEQDRADAVWADGQLVLLNRLTYFMNSALDLVKMLPYWERSQGADHFWLPTADWSRCYSAPPGFAGVGNMFALSTFGERDFRYITQHPVIAPQGSSGMLLNHSRITYGPQMCYEPSRDIVIPSFTLKDVSPVDPLSTKRPIALLIRFSGARYNMYNDGLRARLLQYWEETPYPNASNAVSNLRTTLADMKRSIFCVCPPGQAQWTTRFFRAILMGCIPVTFFVNSDQPFEKELGLDYTKFTVNIVPGQIRSSNQILAGIQGRPERLMAMQRELRRVQSRFSWNREVGDNAPQTIASLLRQRGETFKELHASCPGRNGGFFSVVGALEVKFQENIYLHNPFMYWNWA